MGICMRQEKAFIDVKYGVLVKHQMSEHVETSGKEVDDKSDTSEEMPSDNELESKGKEPAPERRFRDEDFRPGLP